MVDQSEPSETARGRELPQTCPSQTCLGEYGAALFSSVRASSFLTWAMPSCRCCDRWGVVEHLYVPYAAVMKTHIAPWELLAPDVVRLTELVTSRDRLVHPKELLPARAVAERQLGTKLPDRSPERRN